MLLDCYSGSDPGIGRPGSPSFTD